MQTISMCLCVLVLLVTGNRYGHAQAQAFRTVNTQNKEDTMSAEQNKTTVKALYETALNRHDLSLLPRFVSADYISAEGKKGIAAFREPIEALIKALPNVQWTIQSLVAEGSQVAISWQVSGTHSGPFQHLAPTGKTVTNTGMAVYQLKEGKITGVQVLTDRLGFLQSLGALPDPGSQAVNREAHAGQVSFIDKFLVPQAAVQAFHERMKINRAFIKQLPGFLEDAAYEYTDDNGNTVCVTIALWQNREALLKARSIVQAEYAKQGFDMPAFLKKWQITIDRGVYTKLAEE
jgi:predicted ester cyclase